MAGVETTWESCSQASFVLPTGLFAGANNAHNLANPYKSIPMGLFCAIVTSTVLYALIFVLMGSTGPRETLQKDFLLFEQVGGVSKIHSIASYPTREATNPLSKKKNAFYNHII